MCAQNPSKTENFSSFFSQIRVLQWALPSLSANTQSYDEVPLSAGPRDSLWQVLRRDWSVHRHKIHCGHARQSEYKQSQYTKCRVFKNSVFFSSNWLFLLLQCTDKLERDRLILFLNKLILNKVGGISVFLAHCADLTFYYYWHHPLPCSP